MSGSSRILAILLRPAVTFALRRGLKVREILLVVKELLLEEAERLLAQRGEQPSVSRLAVMTGLQRRDVVKVGEGSPETPSQLSIITKLIGSWEQDPKFSKKKLPRPLSFEGTQSEFAELVASISQDISPYTLLFELERLGIVVRREKSLILAQRAYSLRGDSDDSYELLGQDITDLINAVDSNIHQKKEIPNLHITTRYDNICTSKLPEIRQWILERGAAFHSELREVLSKADKDLNPTLFKEKGGGQVVVGSFSLSSLDDESEVALNATDKGKVRS